MPSPPYRLPAQPVVSDTIRRRVVDDFARFARAGLPALLESYLLEAYQLDVRSTYADLPIRNPWGKASGQLSMTVSQVEEDAAAGLGFVVLKTVIAQNAAGDQTMAAWAIPESRMVVERIAGQSGETGWTVTWKGRGWWQSLDAYLELVRQASAVGQQTGMLVVPSCKYHLPGPVEKEWRTSEYQYTTQRLCAASPLNPLPLEKDFSPTLAGSERATQGERILSWLEQVPGLILAAAGEGRVRLGLKLFNALFDDDFQVEMLECVHGASVRPDFLVYANRLIDPERMFEGTRGIAYGGPDLSDRNLRILDRFHDRRRSTAAPPPALLPLSATGNITSGKIAVEYALRGCSSFQMHTLFQLPQSEYRLQTGNRTQKGLHRLYFHPSEGFLVWMHHLAQQLPLKDDRGVIQFSRLPALAPGLR
jgi:hypothetical protein